MSETASKQDRGSTRAGAVGGFTLMELLIVIVVLGVLAAIVILELGGAQGKSAVAACRTDAKSVAIAVRSYSIMHNGSPPASLSDLTTQPNSYLKDLPTSPYYAISLDPTTGSVFVTAPPVGGTPVTWSSLSACQGVSLALSSSGTTTTGATTTTEAPSTTTSSTATSSTTTTSTTTTSTTTSLPSNDVAVVASYSTSHSRGVTPYDRLTISSSVSITQLVVTITIKTGAGERYRSSSVPRGVSAGHVTSGGVITYTDTLQAGKSLTTSPNSFTASYTTSSTHSIGGDTWTVVSTSNGVAKTLSGTF